MNKFEKLIEYIINDEDQKARELFHDIVVEKSRDIYESIMSEEDMEENVHGYATKDLTQEIAAEEQMGENDGEGDEFSLDQDGEEDGEVAGEFPAGEEGEAEEHAEIEDKVMNIDAKLDELLAKFDEIMGDNGSADEMPAEEPSMDADHGIGAEEQFAEAKEGSGNPFVKKGSAQSGKSGKSGVSGSAKSGKSGKPFEGKQSTTELMREYVDRVGEIYGGAGDASEGDAVGGAGKKTSVNAKSITGPGSDFGGTAVTSKGGNADQDGTTPTKASNEYTKGEGEIKSGNRNVPGGKADKLENTGTKYETEHKPEGKLAGADGSRPVNTKSVQAQNTGKK